MSGVGLQSLRPAREQATRSEALSGMSNGWRPRRRRSGDTPPSTFFLTVLRGRRPCRSRRAGLEDGPVGLVRWGRGKTAVSPKKTTASAPRPRVLHLDLEQGFPTCQGPGREQVPRWMRQSFLNTSIAARRAESRSPACPRPRGRRDCGIMKIESTASARDSLRHEGVHEHHRRPASAGAPWERMRGSDEDVEFIRSTSVRPRTTA